MSELYMIIAKHDGAVAAKGYGHPLTARALFCRQYNLSPNEFNDHYEVALQLDSEPNLNQKIVKTIARQES